MPTPRSSHSSSRKPAKKSSPVKSSKRLTGALTEYQAIKKALEVPTDVLESLTDIHERGVGQVRGIAFDLSPDTFHNQGWRPRSRIGLDMGGLNGPLLRFPWRDPLLEDFPDEVWTDIHVGDEIFVKNVEDETIGDALEHSSDQQAKVVTLAIRRGTEEIVLPDAVWLFRETSFSSHWGISYADAVRRVNKIVGNERVKLPVRVRTLDLEIEVLPEHSESKAETEWDFATRAHCAMKDANPDALLRGLKTPKSDSHLKYDLDRFASSAVALGYWLAKAEFAQHAPDALFGKDRRKASKDAGIRTGAEKKRKADQKWRAQGFAIAKDLRQKHPGWGQKRLAKDVSVKLESLGAELPDLDTIIRQIRKWERDDGLERSTQYRRKQVSK